MNEDVSAIIAAVVQRAPHWLRQELASKSDTVRVRAEETMAAMIADVLAKLPVG